MDGNFACLGSFPDYGCGRRRGKYFFQAIKPFEKGVAPGNWFVSKDAKHPGFSEVLGDFIGFFSRHGKGVLSCFLGVCGVFRVEETNDGFYGEGDFFLVVEVSYVVNFKVF